MLQKQSLLSANYCPAPTALPTTTDNRGLFGQPLPTSLYFTSITGSSADLNIDHAWAYDDGYNVVQSPADGNAVSIPNVKYNAYSVFSYDTPTTVQQKANNLVKPYHLGGMWFWDIHNDAYKSADTSKSLYMTAANILGTNTQPNATPSPSPVPSPSRSVVPSPSPSPSPVPSPSPKPSPSPSPSPSPTPGNTCNGIATWSSSTAYTTGQVVVYQGVEYRANWWTQGNNPATNNGGTGSGKPWTKVTNCSVTPTPSPSPSPVPSPSSAAYPTYPSGLGSYQAGSLVYGTNGHLYQCKPWPYSGWCNGSSAYAPGTGSAWSQAWTLVK